MQKIIQVASSKFNELIDITGKIEEAVRISAISTGLVNVYVQGATA